jgi:hypothetical protein
LRLVPSVPSSNPLEMWDRKSASVFILILCPNISMRKLVITLNVFLRSLDCANIYEYSIKNTGFPAPCDV